MQPQASARLLSPTSLISDTRRGKFSQELQGRLWPYIGNSSSAASSATWSALALRRLLRPSRSGRKLICLHDGAGRVPSVPPRARRIDRRLRQRPQILLCVPRATALDEPAATFEMPMLSRRNGYITLRRRSVTRTCLECIQRMKEAPATRWLCPECNKRFKRGDPTKVFI